MTDNYNYPDDRSAEEDKGSAPSKQNHQASEIQKENPTQADNINEFVILTLSKGLGISLLKAQELLTSQCEKLIQLCVNGVSGKEDYSRLIDWMDVMAAQDNYEHLLALCNQSWSQQTFLEVAQALKAIVAPFNSLNGELALRAVRLFQKITNDFYRINTEFYQTLQAWYLRSGSTQIDRERSPLRVTMGMLEKHSDTNKDVAKLLILMFKEPGIVLGGLYAYLKEASSDDIFVCYDSILQLLANLYSMNRHQTTKLIMDTPLAEDVLLEAAENISDDYAVKLTCTSLLLEMYILDPVLITSDKKGLGNLSLKDSILAVVQQTTNEDDSVYRISVLGQAFALLDKLAEIKHAEAPVFYKALILTMIETYQRRAYDISAIEFQVKSFHELFKMQSNIPITAMLEPLVEVLMKRIQTPDFKGFLSQAEIQFLTYVAQHQKFSVAISIQLLNLLQYAYLNRPFLAKAYSVPLLTLIAQFKANSSLQTFVTDQLVPQTLGQMLALKKEEVASGGNKSPQKNNLLSKQNLDALNGEISSPQGEGAHKELGLKTRRFNSIWLIEHVYDVFNRSQGTTQVSQNELVKVSKTILDSTRQVQDRYNQAFKKQSTGLDYLLTKWNVKTEREKSPPKPKQTTSQRKLATTLAKANEAEERAVSVTKSIDFSNRNKAIKTNERVSESQLESIGNYSQVELGSRESTRNGNQLAVPSNRNASLQTPVSQANPKFQSEYSDVEQRVEQSQIGSKRGSLPDLGSQSNSKRIVIGKRGLARDASAPGLGKVREAQTEKKKNHYVVQLGQAPADYKEPKAYANRAIEDIQHIKQQRIEKAHRQELEAIKKKQRKDKIDAQARQEVIQRNLLMAEDASKRKQKVSNLLGQDSSNYQSTVAVYEGSPKKIIQNVGEFTRDNQNSQLVISAQQGRIPTIDSRVEPRRLPNAVKHIRYIDFDTEVEQREQDGVRCVLQRYAPLFQFLFERYANSRVGAHNNAAVVKGQGSHLEYLGNKTMKTEELRKLLKEHNVDIGMVSRAELTALVSVVNSKVYASHEGDAIEFDGFLQWIVQFSIFAFEQKRVTVPNDMAVPSFGQMIEHMIMRFRDGAKARNVSTLLFDSPDQLISTDRQQGKELRRLNQLLMEHPERIHPLPAGYYLDKDIWQVSSYELSEGVKTVLGEPKTIILEILDQLICENLGFHLFEPQVHLNEVSVVKAHIAAKSLTPMLQVDKKAGMKMQSTPNLNKGLFQEVPNPNNQATLSLLHQNLDIEYFDKYFPDLAIYRQENILKMQQVRFAVEAEQRDAESKNYIKVQRRQPGRNVYLSTKELNQQTLILPPKKLKQKREQEGFLNEANLSSDMKVAAYDLIMARPMPEANDIREVAQIMDDICKDVVGVKSYMPKKFRVQKERYGILQTTKNLAIDRSVSIRASSEKPPLGTQVPRIANQEQQKKDAEEQQKKRDYEYLQRGIKLKEKLRNQGKSTLSIEYGKIDGDYQSDVNRDSRVRVGSVSHLPSIRQSSKGELPSINRQVPQDSYGLDREIRRQRKKQLDLAKEERMLKQEKRLADMVAEQYEEKQKRILAVQSQKSFLDRYKNQMSQMSNQMADERESMEMAKAELEKAKQLKEKRAKTHIGQYYEKVGNVKQVQKEIDEERGIIDGFIKRPVVNNALKKNNYVLADSFVNTITGGDAELADVVKMDLGSFSQFAGQAGVFPAHLTEQDLEIVYKEQMNVQEQKKVQSQYSTPGNKATKLGGKGSVGVSFVEFKRMLVLMTIMVIKKADPSKQPRKKKKRRGANGIILNRKINEFGSDTEDIGHVSTQINAAIGLLSRGPDPEVPSSIRLTSKKQNKELLEALESQKKNLKTKVPVSQVQDLPDKAVGRFPIGKLTQDDFAEALEYMVGWLTGSAEQRAFPKTEQIAPYRSLIGQAQEDLRDPNQYDEPYDGQKAPAQLPDPTEFYEADDY